MINFLSPTEEQDFDQNKEDHLGLSWQLPMHPCTVTSMHRNKEIEKSFGTEGEKLNLISSRSAADIPDTSRPQKSVERGH